MWVGVSIVPYCSVDADGGTNGMLIWAKGRVHALEWRSYERLEVCQCDPATGSIKMAGA